MNQPAPERSRSGRTLVVVGALILLFSVVVFAWDTALLMTPEATGHPQILLLPLTIFFVGAVMLWRGIRRLAVRVGHSSHLSQPPPQPSPKIGLTIGLNWEILWVLSAAGSCLPQASACAP